jgi:lysophospholipase L1-like esterase
MRSSQHASCRLFSGLLVTSRAALLATLAAPLWLTACASVNNANNASDGRGGAELAQHRWVASWGSAQQIPDAPNELPAANWRDASLRQTFHLSLGGSGVRVRLSNVHGTAPLMVDGASVALAPGPGKASIDPATLRKLTFDGSASVMIPAGAEYYSDAVALEIKPASDLSVSLYFNETPPRQTSHSGARATSFFAKGNRVMDADWTGAGTIARWFVVSDIDVQAPRGAGALVAVGDSITDGYGVTTDGNDRWPDLLAERLRKDGQQVGVVNVGIGGGRMLRDGLGPNLAARFDRDVLSRAGVTHALVFIGVNDLGGLHRNTPDLPADRKRMLADLRLAHRQLAERARARGICMIGATITPYVGSDYYHPEPQNEADRQEINAWIRSSGVFDAVVDFDAALRDPAALQKIAKPLDSGDHLHPSLAGYRALADAVPLDILRRDCTRIK